MTSRNPHATAKGWRDNIVVLGALAAIAEGMLRVRSLPRPFLTVKQEKLVAGVHQ